MTESMKFHNSVIITIPGIGYINGGITLGIVAQLSCTVIDLNTIGNVFLINFLLFFVLN